MSEVFRPEVRGSRSHLIPFLLILIVSVMVFVGVALTKDLYGALTMRYEVTGEALLIHYGFRTEEVPLDQISQTWVLAQPTRAVRLFGTSTSGLKSGRWRTAETGPLVLYATRLEDLVILETPGGKVGLSPADVAGFERSLSDRSPGNFAPAGSRGQVLRGMLLPFFFLALVLVLGIGTLIYTKRFPDRLAYELGSDLLTIHTGWRPVRVALREVARAEVAEPKGSPLRIYGAHLPGILWGRFAWRQAGPNLSLYATQTRPLVLLHLRGGKTIGISPADRDGFVAALQRRIG